MYFRTSQPSKIIRGQVPKQGCCIYLGPTQVKCQLLNYDIFLNEFSTYFGKCHKLIYACKPNQSADSNIVPIFIILTRSAVRKGSWICAFITICSHKVVILTFTVSSFSITNILYGTFSFTITFYKMSKNLLLAWIIHCCQLSSICCWQTAIAVCRIQHSCELWHVNS